MNQGCHPKKNKLLLLATGGTIASLPDHPAKTHMSAQELLDQMESITRFYPVEAEEIFCQDSVNFQPQQWPELAQRIYDRCDGYDGIVVTHGTDTMAYTAAMLSFMLHRIPIPVVLTGAQRPLIHPESDGLSNLRCAFAMASSRIGGVFVAFHNHVILGSHAVKSRSSSFQAFESVGVPCVASLCSHGLVVHKESIPHQDGTKNLQLAMCDKVFLWKLSPASRPNFADDLIQAGIRGVVIEGYGKGHLPNGDRAWKSALEKFQAHQIPVVLCGQCQQETDRIPETVSSGSLIFAWDMTTEAAVTKLMWSLGQVIQAQEAGVETIENVAKIFHGSLVGEKKEDAGKKS
ncbi:MAG: asparaginase [Clostridiales bacterium]|jgi:L-asparaginase|nr:asparaginase [Clostridiales bacterium]